MVSTVVKVVNLVGTLSILVERWDGAIQLHFQSDFICGEQFF